MTKVQVFRGFNWLVWFGYVVKTQVNRIACTSLPSCINVQILLDFKLPLELGRKMALKNGSFVHLFDALQVEEARTRLLHARWLIVQGEPGQVLSSGQSPLIARTTRFDIS